MRVERDIVVCQKKQEKIKIYLVCANRFREPEGGGEKYGEGGLSRFLKTLMEEPKEKKVTIRTGAEGR